MLIGKCSKTLFKDSQLCSKPLGGSSPRILPASVQKRTFTYAPVLRDSPKWLLDACNVLETIWRFPQGLLSALCFLHSPRPIPFLLHLHNLHAETASSSDCFWFLVSLLPSLPISSDIFFYFVSSLSYLLAVAGLLDESFLLLSCLVPALNLTCSNGCQSNWCSWMLWLLPLQCALFTSPLAALMLFSSCLPAFLRFPCLFWRVGL